MIPQTLDFNYYEAGNTFHVLFDSCSVNENTIHCIILSEARSVPLGFALDKDVLKEIDSCLYKSITEKMESVSKEFWAENKVKQDQHFGRMKTFDATKHFNNFFDKIKTA